MGSKEDINGLVIDDTIDMQNRVEVPIQRKETKVRKQVPEYKDDDEPLVSCLRNERIKIKHINKAGGIVSNPNHVLYGGMAETATRTFVTPILSSGAYKNVLTDSEKKFLEEEMGLEYNALSVYKRDNNFWDSGGENSLARVTLQKQDNYLDLSDPKDYIRYKILLANKDYIAPSMQELEDHPKATYEFVIISEGDEVKNAGVKLSAKKQCYKALGSIGNDVDTLRVIIETLEGKPTSKNVKFEFLETRADELITADSKAFLKVVSDPMLNTKVLLKKSIEAGLVGKKGDGYYLKDGTPLCEMNEDPTLNIAAKYLNAPKHQDVKLMLEAKLK